MDSIKQNLWLILLVGLAVGLGAFYFARTARPPATGTPTATSSPGATATTATHAPQRPAKPLPPERLSLPRRGLPQGAEPPAIDLTGQHPLPAGLTLVPYQDPQGRFRLALPSGWTGRPGPQDGPVLELVGPDQERSGITAVVYLSTVPPASFDQLQRKLAEAARSRGERLVSSRYVQDGESRGLEVITTVPARDGKPALRQRAFFVRQGARLAQLLVSAPEARYADHAGLFHALARSLQLGSRTPPAP